MFLIIQIFIINITIIGNSLLYFLDLINLVDFHFYLLNMLLELIF